MGNRRKNMYREYFSSEKNSEPPFCSENFLSRLTNYLDDEQREGHVEKKCRLELSKPCKEIFLLDSNDTTQEFFLEIRDQFSRQIDLKVFDHQDDFFGELAKRENLPSHIFFSSRHSDLDYHPDFLSGFMKKLKSFLEKKCENSLSENDRPEIVFLSSVDIIRQDAAKKNCCNVIDHIMPKDFSSIWLAIEKSYKIEQVKQQIENLAFVADDKELDDDLEIVDKIQDLNLIFIDDDADTLHSLERCSIARGDEIGEANCLSFNKAIKAYNYFKQVKEKLNGGFSTKKYFVILDGNLKKDKELKSGDLFYIKLKELLKDDINHITFIANSGDIFWNTRMKYEYGFLNSQRGMPKDVMGSFDLIIEEIEKGKEEAIKGDLL